MGSSSLWDKLCCSAPALTRKITLNKNRALVKNNEISIAKVSMLHFFNCALVLVALESSAAPKVKAYLSKIFMIQ